MPKSLKSKKPKRDLKSISMTPIGKQHCVVAFERPGRVEISVQDGILYAFVYEGAKTNIEDDCIGMFDGSLKQHNGAWTDKGE